jgi:hypothetical protein
MDFDSVLALLMNLKKFNIKALVFLSSTENSQALCPTDSSCLFNVCATRTEI